MTYRSKEGYFVRFASTTTTMLTAGILALSAARPHFQEQSPPTALGTMQIGEPPRPPSGAEEHFILTASDLTTKPIDVKTMSTEEEFAQLTWTRLQTEYPRDYEAFMNLHPSTDTAIKPEERGRIYALDICAAMVDSNNPVLQEAGTIMETNILSDTFLIGNESRTDWFLHEPRIAVGPVFEGNRVILKAKIIEEDLMANQNPLVQAYRFVYFASYFTKAQQRFLDDEQKIHDFALRIITWKGWKATSDERVTNGWETSAREAQRQTYHTYAPLSIREMLNR